MKLHDLQIFPQGGNGWGSGVLTFGQHITQLYGPNGCGKTPIVQSIAYCLGYPCIFRNDIYDKCSHVVLNVEYNANIISIKRIVSRDVDVEVTINSKSTERYFDEKSYSEFIFDTLGISFQNLVGTTNKICTPYMSTLLPLFYLDQDEGYSNFYCPPSSFIKDQFSEMVRILFDLPVKNSFDAKKEKIYAKENLDRLDRSVELMSRQVEMAVNSCRNINKSPEELIGEIKYLEMSVEQLKDSSAIKSDSLNVYDQQISRYRLEIIKVTNEIAEIQKRTKSINQIVHEINSEVDTLTLNEDARRLFKSFNEICDSSDCKLFSVSSESYSKNLLYLKDQIKDLERNADLDQFRIQELLIQRKSLELSVKTAVDEKNAALARSEVAALVDAISALKSQIFELQGHLSEVEKAEDLREKYFKIKIERDKAYDKYISFSSDKSTIPELVRVKAKLRECFLNWLEALHTINISRDITFKDDFVPVFGKETISQLKGSTRIRAVLAYHAALIELTSSTNSSGLRFMILDTPKQHEISNIDLDRYFHSLKELTSKQNVQIIFSTTEYRYLGDGFDKDWIPEYSGNEQNMFLKDPKYNKQQIN